MTEAIIYTSNTGFTRRYAQMLSEKTGIKAYPLSDAPVKDGARVIYMGWLAAGVIQGYKKAAKKYDIAAVCAVGMAETGSQTEDVTRTNGIKVPLFTLQGGFYMDRLTGRYKFMMQVMKKTFGKSLMKKKDRTEAQDDMIDLLFNGGDRVKEENLEGILGFLKAGQQ